MAVVTGERPSRTGPVPGPRSELNQLRGPEGRSDGVGIAGTPEDVHGGIGELDHVRVAVLDCPREDLPCRLLAGPLAWRLWQLSPRRGLSGSVDGGQRAARGPGRRQARPPQPVI